MDLFWQILGMTLIIIGLIGLFIAVGGMLYPLYLSYRAQYFGKPQPPADLSPDGQTGRDEPQP